VGVCSNEIPRAAEHRRWQPAIGAALVRLDPATGALRDPPRTSLGGGGRPSPDVHGDASRPGPTLRVGHDPQCGCRGRSPLLCYGEGVACVSR